MADATLRGMDETMLSNLIASFLYFKSSGRPDKDFITYVTTKELWGTAAMGLNLIGAMIPAMIFDKEFRMLAIKTGMNKGSEIASKTIEMKLAKTDLDAATNKVKERIGMNRDK